MKSLNEFYRLVEEEKSDYSKFDVLVRAGLANKAQMQRIHKILDKMQEEKPVFNNADRAILQNLFNKMVDLISNNKQIFAQARRAVKEEAEVLDEATPDSPDDPPFMLVLKRKQIRMFPNKMKVALYYNDKIGKYFTIPYGPEVEPSTLQAEDTEMIEEAVMDQLHNIVAGKQSQKVKFGNGQTQTVDHYTASAVTQVHKHLNDENKKKLSDMVHKSPAHLAKAADFAFKRAK